MCSIVEDDFENEATHAMIEDLSISEEIVNTDEICKKCKVEKVLIKLKLKDGRCKDCFLAYVVHKFRANLGSTKIVKRDSEVLMHFDGSDASVCLLHMIQDAAKVLHKKLRFTLHLVHIDESSVSTSENINDVGTILEQFSDTKCHFICLGSDQLSDSKCKPTDSNNETFLKIFNSVYSLSAKQELVSRTKTNMLHKIANELKCQYIFIPDIGINLAKTLLSNVSLGRGGSVADDVQFCDDRSEEIKLIRPIRDLTKEEIKNYLKFLSLKCLDVKTFGSDNGSSASIQNLTSAFVDGLQKNFSSTISTVFKTADKIKHSPEFPEIRCAFCKSLVDYHDAPTLYAIEYSRLVTADATSASDKVARNIEQEAEKAVSGDIRDLQKKLCHGCRNIFNGLDDDDNEIETIFR